MRVVQRVIVIRQADGSDYVHTYPHTTYQSITEMMREHGETFVTELAQDMFDQRQRSMARYDAIRESREVTK